MVFTKHLLMSFIYSVSDVKRQYISVCVCLWLWLLDCVSLLASSWRLVALITLQHDLDPVTLACGLKGLSGLLQGEAVGHQWLHVHLPRRQHGDGHGPAGDTPKTTPITDTIPILYELKGITMNAQSVMDGQAKVNLRLRMISCLCCIQIELIQDNTR